MTTLTIQQNRIAQYWALTKPRVTQLAVFCAVIGMFLATPGLPDWRLLIAATVGIWLLAGAAFAIVNAVLHFATDWCTSRVTKRLWLAEQRHWFFVVIGLDQSIHMTCLLGTYGKI